MWAARWAVLLAHLFHFRALRGRENSVYLGARALVQAAHLRAHFVGNRGYLFLLLRRQVENAAHPLDGRAVVMRAIVMRRAPVARAM